MKRFVAAFFFFFLLLFLIPALALPPTGIVQPAPANTADTYRVLDIKTDTVLSLTPTEYIKGVVAAEMPASYHAEALKAQAVASHSYALYRIREHIDAGKEGAYLSTDPASCQAYLSEAERKALWGDSFAQYEQALTEAVESVIDTVLTVQGEPILAVFHAVSGGNTHAAKDVFGVEYAYLTSVESPNDELSPDFMYETTFTADEMKSRLSPLLTTSLSENPSDWFGAPSTASSGVVLNTPVGDQSLTGSDLREALSLPSLHFIIEYADNTFTVQSYGKGHGVGMSQYGADFLARQGQTYEQILLHYYTGSTLSTLS